MRLARALYRTRQALHALRPSVDGREVEQARELLSEYEARLFFAMERRDQRHALEVMRRALQSTDDRSILAAALLHDCGKGEVSMWQRIAHVCLGGHLSSVEARIASVDGHGWRRAMYRLRYHPDIGAELAASADSDPETVRLIRAQEHEAPDPRLAILQAADNM
jgi:hypothetical protein